MSWLAFVVLVLSLPGAPNGGWIVQKLHGATLKVWRQVGVPHGRADVRVTKETLHHHHGHPSHGEVGRKGVAQDVPADPTEPRTTAGSPDGMRLDHESVALTCNEDPHCSGFAPPRPPLSWTPCSRTGHLSQSS